MHALPKDFLLGSMTGGHRFEGQNFASDWWRWEQRPHRIRENATSQEASGQLSRYRDDLEMAARLGHRAVIIVAEWSRVEPADGAIDESGLEYYAGLFEAAHAEGLEIICALQHVTRPRWFSENFGWCHGAAVERYGRYVRAMGEAAGPFCRRWIPLFEPDTWVRKALRERVWPGGKDRNRSAKKASESLSTVHTEAHRILKGLFPDADVGIGVHPRRTLPLNPDRPDDIQAARRLGDLDTRLFLENCRSCGTRAKYRGGSGTMPADFLLVIYDEPEIVRSTLFGGARSMDTREVDPEAAVTEMERMLEEYSAYETPIIAACTGTNSPVGADRVRRLHDRVQAVRSAQRRGVPISGYFHVPLLDGFEWELGYTERRGLVHVNYRTMSRTPNPEAIAFLELCETGAWRPGSLTKYGLTKSDAIAAAS